MPEIEYWYRGTAGWHRQLGPPGPSFIRHLRRESQASGVRFIVAVRRTPVSLEEVPRLGWAVTIADPGGKHRSVLVDERGAVAFWVIIKTLGPFRQWAAFDASRRRAEKHGWRVLRGKDLRS